MKLLKVVVLVSAFFHITMVLSTEGEHRVFESIHSVVGESIRSSIVISIPSVISAGLYHVSLP